MGRTWRGGAVLGAVVVAGLVAVPGTAQAAVGVSVPERVDEGADLVVVLDRVLALDDLGARSVTVRVTGASAVVPADVAAVDRTVSWNALQGGVRTVAVPVAQDALDEDPESFVVEVSQGGPPFAARAVTIDDDDAPPRLSVDDVAVAEGAGVVEVPVRLAAPSGRRVRATAVLRPGSAPAAAVPADGELAAAEVVLAPGATTTTVPVRLQGDTMDEPDEHLALELTELRDAAAGDVEADVLVRDDDEAPRTVLPGPPSAPAPPGPLPPGLLPAPTTGSSLPRLRLTELGGRGGKVGVRVACPRSTGACRVELTVFTRKQPRSRFRALRKERRLGVATTSVPAGATRTVRMTLRKADLKLLRGAGSLPVAAYAVGRDRDGQVAVAQARGTLTR